MIKLYNFIISFIDIFLFYFPITFTVYAIFALITDYSIIIKYTYVWCFYHLFITLCFTLFDYFYYKKKF